MGFKCRLFGHTYGNPEVERSRKEEGDEVVVTIRNVKRCERCGDEKMVNQTKEVTSVRSPEEVGLDTSDASSTAPGPPDASDSTPDPSRPGEATGNDDGESPVTPVDPGSEPPSATGPAATPDPEASVDATVGPDVAPGTDAPADPAGVGPDDGAVAADDTAAAPQDGRGVDDHPNPTDSLEPPADWDEDAAVEAVEGATAADTSDAADRTDASPTEESADVEATDDGWETGSDEWDDVDPDPDVDDAVILDAGETQRDEVQWPEESDATPDADTADPESATDAADPDAPEQAATDAEIIDADESTADPAEATAGGWPDHEDPDAAGNWPDHDTADEGYSAAPNGDVDTDFGGSGLTPEVNGGAPQDPAAVDGIAAGGADSGAVERPAADSDTGTDPEFGEGFVRAGDSTTGDVPADRVEFYCPNCGHARVAGASSIRAGDICPECKRGYIAERER